MNETTRVVTAVRTAGLARKIVAACGIQAVALLVNLIASGAFDRVELSQLVGLAGTAIVGWAVNPGRVEIEASSAPAPDAHLSKP